MTLAFREVDDGGLPPRSHPTILIIDDDTPSWDWLAATLSVEGFDVVTAAIGDEGMALVWRRSALADPARHGARRLAGPFGVPADRGGVGVPVIMITARDDELDAVLSLEAGAADHITKPPRPRELTARIRAVLRRVGNRPGGQLRQPARAGSTSSGRCPSICPAGRRSSGARWSGCRARSSTSSPC